MARSVFTGGLSGLSGPYLSGPFGRLDFDDKELVITGNAVAKRLRFGEVRVAPSDVKEILVETGVLAVRVTVIMADGKAVEPRFAGLMGRPIITALEAAGWPVTDRRWFKRRRS